jgi:hypothetical protein
MGMQELGLLLGFDALSHYRQAQGFSHCNDGIRQTVSAVAAVMSRMNERSILIVSSGKRCNIASDEYPVRDPSVRRIARCFPWSGLA